jgi:inositol 1,4,5-triphosphate receptor type 1
MVLLQMLCDYKPSIAAEIEADGGIEMDQSTTTSVEVSWGPSLSRRFFHVPDLCSLLAKSSKDKLVLEVKRDNPENKLINFLERSHDLYAEVCHQRYLTDLGIAAVFSLTNKDRATWCTFILATIINSLMVAYYNAKDGTPNMPDHIVFLISILNYIQIFTASFTAILTVVVRSPVIAMKYAKRVEQGYMQPWQMYLYTALDPMTLYYWGYLVIAILGTVVADYYLCLQMLDIIVKDVTTADVLVAIIQPRVQLGYALLLGVFVCYIFSFYTFIYYAEQVDSGDEVPFCQTLYGCVKFCISYGLQNGGGIADNMVHAKDNRLILDLMWFIVVLVIFINIIFGIIIDTFSSLRADKIARMKNTLETCFICSINRQQFDRASDAPNGFATHIAQDHNMW